jgi:hypothetical protein
MDLINTLFFINQRFVRFSRFDDILMYEHLEHVLFALTNTTAGNEARFSMFYSSITAQLRIHFFKSQPFWL